MKTFDTMTTYEREDRARRFEVKISSNGRSLGVYRSEKMARAKADKTPQSTYIVQFLQW